MFSFKKFIKFIFINVLCRLIALKVFKIFCITNQIKDNIIHLVLKNKIFFYDPLGYNERYI